MKWGIIGTRGYAARSATPGVQASKKGELVAVLGRDPDRTTEFAREHDVEVAATELDEFLATPGLESIWIVSPTFLHHPQGMAALKAGKHVLLEKPLAPTAAEAWELVETAKETGVVLATGYQGRYIPGHQSMKKLIAEGAIGDVTVVVLTTGFIETALRRSGASIAKRPVGVRWPTSEPTISICCACSSGK